MKNQDLAFNFAKGATKGKSNNMFIEGDIIYSYGHHFPIAKRLTNNKALFTTKGYSQSTACHKGYVKRALEAYHFRIREVEEVKQ